MKWRRPYWILKKCHWTKFCTPSGKCCLRPLWTHINRQKKSVQQFHLKCDFLLTIQNIYENTTIKRRVFKCVLKSGSVSIILTEFGNWFQRVATATEKRRSPCLTVCENGTENSSAKADLNTRRGWCRSSSSVRYSGARPCIIVLDLAYRPVCNNVLAAFLTWIKLVGP